MMVHHGIGRTGARSRCRRPHQSNRAHQQAHQRPGSANVVPLANHHSVSNGMYLQRCRAESIITAAREGIPEDLPIRPRTMAPLLREISRRRRRSLRAPGGRRSPRGGGNFDRTRAAASNKDGSRSSGGDCSKAPSPALIDQRLARRALLSEHASQASKRSVQAGLALAAHLECADLPVHWPFARASAAPQTAVVGIGWRVTGMRDCASVCCSRSLARARSRRLSCASHTRPHVPRHGEDSRTGVRRFVTAPRGPLMESVHTRQASRSIQVSSTDHQNQASIE